MAGPDIPEPVAHCRHPGVTPRAAARCPPALSIIVPVLNEAATIELLLRSLQSLRAQGVEVVVVDGGSEDDTTARAASLCDRLVHGPRGRARQMNAGAAASGGQLLMFLHADTFLPPGLSAATLLASLRGHSPWGFCSVRLSGRHPLLRWVEWLMNRRSRLTGIGTGDQALWTDRRLFESLGGFPDLPLMEDVAICRELKRCGGRPGNPGILVTTSSRRWEQGGILRTIVLMWLLRLRFFLGADPATLARRYYRS